MQKDLADSCEVYPLHTNVGYVLCILKVLNALLAANPESDVYANEWNKIIKESIRGSSLFHVNF